MANEKEQAQIILMILKVLLSTRLIWMILTKILKNAIQIGNVKY